MRKLLWTSVFGGILATAVRRVARVRPPIPEERPAQWGPLRLQ